MRVIERWKRKRKMKDILGCVVASIKIRRRAVAMSVVSFALGYVFNALQNDRLKFEDKDIYFGDSPNYASRSNNPSTLLVILIFSSVGNFGRREVIRRTWLSEESERVVHLFAISAAAAGESEKASLQNEQETRGDLLIFPNLEDSFYLLATKLVASFAWLTDIRVLGREGESSREKQFADFRFVLKCDDDSYVRVKEIASELETAFDGDKGTNLYWGFFDGRARPKSSGKYKEDRWNICDLYVPYALGGGYVLSRSLVRFIAANGNHLARYRSEDVSVGAWLSSYSDIKRVHDPRFDTEYISRGCHHSYLVTHKHSEKAMTDFHENLKRTGRLCRKEFRTRISYNYDWSVPPSKCCARNNPDIP